MSHSEQLKELVYDFIHQISEAMELTYSIAEKESFMPEAYIFFEAQLGKIAKQMADVRLKFPLGNVDDSKGYLN